MKSKDSSEPKGSKTPEWIEKWTKNIEKDGGPQGFRKMILYVNEITQTPYFKDLIKSLRKRYDIPETGFPYKDRRVFPPEQWRHRHTKVNKRLKKEVADICKFYHLHFLYWSDMIENILFYNNHEPLGDITESGFGLCMFTDLKNEYEEPFGKEIQEADNDAFPLAIRISPYASERDVLDFIKRTYPMIEHWQQQYRKESSKIGKLKKKKAGIKERNDFIYENKHLPRKEIMTLVYEKFGEHINIDYGYIGKIISMEKKKRKDV